MKKISKHTKNKFFFGAVKVGERGQIVIPAEARKAFQISPGDKLLVFGDIKKGIGLIKATKLRNLAVKLFEAFEIGNKNEEDILNSDKNEKE
ncbi:MAG: AbrB/MazE/SpoVT family DNA-binding domain-containing protein [Promethearchaeota archaeon]